MLRASSSFLTISQDLRLFYHLWQKVLLSNEGCWYVSAPVALRQIRSYLLYLVDKVNLRLWEGDTENAVFPDESRQTEC